MKAQYETQLISRRMDENGDMTFGLGESGFIHGLDAMKQVLKTRIAAHDGEWWESDSKAIPYMTDVLAAARTGANKDAIDLLIIERIMDTVGVLGVSNVQSSFEGRSYRFSCNVQTVYGETTAEVNV